ncbi:uncharacterized protein LOC133205114 [Saccostrea echinata]|uniref:uncharacterized protein LOC133205114 n=1 Tax=Saccostrea echinata TaxID=191078 RepID=UPI002A80C576|nr:uncharacterized protein LOC133205114 [Saccostrea echinata]
MSDERNSNLLKTKLLIREENLTTASTGNTTSTPGSFSRTGVVSPEPRTWEDGVTKGPQKMLIYQQDNGQIWAIIGCALTIGNIIAALVIYTYKRRKRRLRQRGRTRDAGRVPSDSHYTLPTNPDPHYLQIMDNPEGTSARKRHDLDDGGYITAIERNSEKNSGYTDIVHFSSSQRSNSYQEITEVSELSLSSHSPVHGTRSLDPPMRIHKRRDKYLVNINIPSDSIEESVRQSYVLSPELMDEELSESLTNFSKYFTSLSVKKKKESSNCEKGEESTTNDDIIDDGNEIKENKMKDTEDKSSSSCLQSYDKDTIDHENTTSARESQKGVKNCDGKMPLFNDLKLKGQNSSSVISQELPMEIPVEQQSASHIKRQDQTTSDEEPPTRASANFDQSSVSSRENLYHEKVSKVSLPNTECLENRTTLKDRDKIDNKDSDQAYAFPSRNEKVWCKEPGGINDNLLLKKSRGLMLAPMTSFNSDHSLNNYIRKNGILLPVKTAADDSSVADKSYKRDTL